MMRIKEDMDVVSNEKNTVEKLTNSMNSMNTWRKDMGENDHLIN